MTEAMFSSGKNGSKGKNGGHKANKWGGEKGKVMVKEVSKAKCVTTIKIGNNK
jgi:hypothetical protein